MGRLRTIGYWKGEAEPDLPDPADFVDEAWDDDERREVAAYLRSATILAVAAGFSTCRICGQPNGSAELTDGTYLWPEGLAHYVDKHFVRLPAEVCQHIRDRSDALLDEAEVDRDWWVQAMAAGR